MLEYFQKLNSSFAEIETCQCRKYSFKSELRPPPMVLPGVEHSDHCTPVQDLQEGGGQAATVGGGAHHGAASGQVCGCPVPTGAAGLPGAAAAGSQPCRGAQAGAHCAHGDGGTQGLVLRIIDVENAHNAMARAAVLEE